MSYAASLLTRVPNPLVWYLEVVMVAPDGTRFDVSDRLTDFGTLTDSVEEDLLELTHGELDFDLDDRDGKIEAFLGNAKPDQYYTVEVWRDLARRRDRSARRGIQYLFLGLLDLPWSIEYDRKDNTVHIQVYSLTKLLERTSAEVAQRVGPVVSTTGSVSAASRTVTVPLGTPDFASGDEIQLSDANTAETQIVARVLSATTLQTREAWTNTYTNAPLVLLTPYFRWARPAILAQILIAFSGCGHGDVELEGQVSEVPFVSPMNANGLPYPSGLLGSAVETAAGELTIYVPTGLSGDVGKYVGSPRDGARFDFTADVSIPVTGDWTPYLLTRPTNFPAAVGANDNGSRAWNHTGNTSYSIGLSISGGTDSVFTIGGGPGTVDTYVGTESYTIAKVEYDPINNRVWAAYTRSDLSRSIIEVYDIGGASWSDITGSAGGHLRMCRALGYMIWVSEDLQTVKLYDTTTKTVLRTISGEDANGLDVLPGVTAQLIPWSFRHLADENGPGHILATYKQAGRVRLRVWSVDWNVVADYDVAPAYPPTAPVAPFPLFNVTIDPQLFGFTDPDLGPVLILSNGHTSPEWGVVSRRFAGVIPYADLEGESIASGIRELAVMGLGVVRADHTKFEISILPRTLNDVATVDLSDPLELDEMHVSELYRTSAAVSGESGGDSFTAVSGANPARRIELTSKFASSESFALVIATAYRAALQVIGRERHAVYEDDGTILQPMTIVRADGKRWLILESDTDLRNYEVKLRMVEIAD